MRYLNVGSTGPFVMQVQSILRKLGYYKEEIDGLYGAKTVAAVKRFQRDFKLFTNGGVDFVTWDHLDRFIYGFDKYYIKKDDTIQSIAQMYNTRADLIASANPGLVNKPDLVKTIAVPYNFDVVLTDVEYTYDICEKAIRALKVRYPYIEIGDIGKTVLGKKITYIRIGTGPRKVFINAAHHAIEWITTPLVLKFCENILKRNMKDTSLLEHKISDVLNLTSLYIVPMVNPDGVDLVNLGPEESNPYYNELMRYKNGGTNFHTQWKANIRGVDLNRNYPAGWEKSKKQELSLDIKGPAAKGFGGYSALSEPESRAMADFTNKMKFDLTISYHTQGEEIYWKYGDKVLEGAERYANQFKKFSGYTFMSNPPNAAYAGYKDWFIDVHGKPGFTIEAGSGQNPLPISQFGKIYRENEFLMFSALL